VFILYVVINKQVRGCSPDQLSKAGLIPINRNIRHAVFLTLKRRAADVLPQLEMERAFLR
jgi:hypothetical protein